MRSRDDSGLMPLRSLSRTPSKRVIPARSFTKSAGGLNSTSAIIAASSRDGASTGAVSSVERTVRSAWAVIGSWQPVLSSWLPIDHACAECDWNARTSGAPITSNDALIGNLKRMASASCTFGAKGFGGRPRSTSPR